LVPTFVAELCWPNFAISKRCCRICSEIELFLEWTMEPFRSRVTANRYKIALELTQGLEAAADARKILWWPATLNRLPSGKGKSNPNCYCCGYWGWLCHWCRNLPLGSCGLERCCWPLQWGCAYSQVSQFLWLGDWIWEWATDARQKLEEWQHRVRKMLMVGGQ